MEQEAENNPIPELNRLDTSDQEVDLSALEELPNQSQLDSPSIHEDSGMSSLHESVQYAENTINVTAVDDEENSNISSISGDEDEIVVSESVFPVSNLDSKEVVEQSKEVVNVCCESVAEKETEKEEFATEVEIENQLPETVTVLTTECGGKVYIVGTAHFSKESQNDVKKTITMVRPDAIVLELCKARFSVLQLNEKKVLEESLDMNFAKMRNILREQGKMQGILYILLLYTTAHVTKELGMAPGGEFRTAFNEVQTSLPNCKVILGDRPIDITLSRALASLSLWKKMKLIVHILASKEPISKEDVEKYKQKDFIEELMRDLTGQFPEIHEVFVRERDMFLSKSLQYATQTIGFPYNKHGTSNHPVVVGVVGIGHVSGIVDNWNKVRTEDIDRIMIIPPKSMTEKISLFTLKYSFYGCLVFATYKCLPVSVKSNLLSAANSFSANILQRFSK